MKVITQDQMFDDFAFIIELTDDELKQIEEEPNKVNTDIDLMKRLVLSKGNNAHVLQLTLNNDIAIIGHAQRLLGIYKSVSWVGRDTKFHIKRR